MKREQIYARENSILRQPSKQLDEVLPRATRADPNEQMKYEDLVRRVQKFLLIYLPNAVEKELNDMCEDNKDHPHIGSVKVACKRAMGELRYATQTFVDDEF